MAGLQLQPLPAAGQRFVDEQGNLDPVARLALQAILDQIVDAVNGVVEAQAAAAAAQTAADAADAAAAAAQTAADSAQTAAEDAQAAVDAIVVPPSGTRTVTVSDNITDADATILADATAGAIILSLPPAATISTTIRVQKVDASANTVTIDADGTDAINGNPTLGLTVQYEDANLNSDGIADWYAS